MKYYGIKAPLEKRLKSTSGGVFQLLAEDFLNKGGLVFGAGFDECMSVVYKKVTSIDELPGILGSKYVEASTDGLFADVFSSLSEGRKVLFVGSPCTVSALKSFVSSKDNLLLDFLYLVDFICSGVPERGFWEAYLHFMEQGLKRLHAADHIKITDFIFRDKQRPDSAHTVSWEYDVRYDGNDVLEHRCGNCGFMEDRYCRIFTKTISLQQRCFQCRWCSLERPGDLTIGDYWGVEKYHPEFDDGYGVSLCISGNARGDALLGTIIPEVESIGLDKSEIMQPRLASPNKASILNTLFRRDLVANGKPEECDMEMILKKYGN